MHYDTVDKELVQAWVDCLPKSAREPLEQGPSALSCRLCDVLIPLEKQPRHSTATQLLDYHSGADGTGEGLESYLRCLLVYSCAQVSGERKRNA